MSTARICLSLLNPGEGGIIESVNTPHDMKLKLLEMGIAEGEFIRFVRPSPLGDPLEFELMDYRLAIRKDEADLIFLKSDSIHR